MHMELSFQSTALERRAHVLVVTPDEQGEHLVQGRLLWLLHGKSADRYSWLEHTRVAHYARTPRITLILPQAENSFYTDMVYGERFYTHIAQEVPALLERVLRMDLSSVRQYMAGYSMGGYGALKLALKQPNRFRGVAALSGSLRTVAENRALIQSGSRPDLAACFGDYDAAVAEENCPFRLTERWAQSGGKLSPIYLYCGKQDALYPQNQCYRAYATALGVPLTWHEDNGKHDYQAWDQHIRGFIREGIVGDTK